MLQMTASGTVIAWNPDDGSVTTLSGAHPTQVGRHSHAIYNPIRDEVLFFSGDTREAVSIVGADGVVMAQENAPAAMFDGKSQATMFEFYDPVTGNYLTYSQSGRWIYEFNPDAVGTKWALARTLAGTPNSGPTYHGWMICPIPEAGVILWQHRQLVRLYKHQGVL